MTSSQSKTNLTNLSSSHSFTPLAPEFIPGRPYGSTAGHNDDDLTTGLGRMGLSLTAGEFIPGVGRLNSNNNNNNNNNAANNAANNVINHWNQAPTNSSIDATDQTIVEKMVEVHWNGSTFYAPLSQTYMGEDGLNTYIGPVDGIDLDLGHQHGLQWANNSYTLPAPPKRTLQTIGISEPIRSHFQALDIEALRQMAPDDIRYKELPIRYHSAYPLDGNDRALHVGNSSFGYPSSLYKAIDQTDSQIYAVRRLDNVRTTQSVVLNTMSLWQSIRHPSIVTLYGVTIEKGALFFSYHYHPCAQSLKERFIDQRGPLIAESLIWRLLVQLLTALRHVHHQGGSIRVVDPAHVILTSGTNARFSCVGVLDVLEFESRKTVSELQKDDLAKLGRLVLSLISRAMITIKNSEDALVITKQHYSLELQNVIIALISYKSNVNQVYGLMSERILDELDTSMTSADALHSHLHMEYENGRLLRLLLKLGTINERPDRSNNINSLAPQWSETGDQYVLKLFRDYIFHQCDADGHPVLDAGHMITALNKLDAGDPEEILLSCRDGKDLLVVSYQDVQRCLEKSFVDLSQQQVQYVPTVLDPPSQQQQQLSTTITTSNSGTHAHYLSTATSHKRLDKAYSNNNNNNIVNNNSMYTHQDPTSGIYSRAIPSGMISRSTSKTGGGPVIAPPGAAYTSGVSSAYNAVNNNPYIGVSAATSTAIGTHNSYLQPTTYGLGRGASDNPSTGGAMSSSNKAAAQMAWENSRSIQRGMDGKAVVARGHISPISGSNSYYGGTASQGGASNYINEEYTPPAPPPLNVNSRMLPMSNPMGASHESYGHLTRQPSSHMLSADPQASSSLAGAGAKGYYNSSLGMGSSNGSWSPSAMQDPINRGSYGLSKNTQPSASYQRF